MHYLLQIKYEIYIATLKLVTDRTNLKGKLIALKLLIYLVNQTY